MRSKLQIIPATIPRKARSLLRQPVAYGELTVAKQALLVIDMQRALFAAPKHDADAVVARINRLSSVMRAKQAPVIFIQHCGPEGHELHPSQPGHAIHADLVVQTGDKLIPKLSCDAFLDTTLASTLKEAGVEELIVTGFATDFCVDTTVRSSLAKGYITIVPEDGHTTSDRPYLSAEKVIEHHNFVWANLITPVGAARMTRCGAIA